MTEVRYDKIEVVITRKSDTVMAHISSLPGETRMVTCQPHEIGEMIQEAVNKDLLRRIKGEEIAMSDVKTRIDFLLDALGTGAWTCVRCNTVYDNKAGGTCKVPPEDTRWSDSQSCSRL